MQSLKSPKSAKQKILCWVFIIILLVIIAGFLAPLFLMKSHVYTTASEAVNNARQIGIFLLLYDQDHGQFPTSRLPKDLKIGKYTQQNREDSNYILGHFLRADYTESEEIFYARIPQKTKRADGIISPDSEILTRGECGFTYLTYEDGPMSTSESGDLPVLITPLISNSTQADSEIFDGEAIYLRLDSSVQRMPIDKNGRIIIKNKKSQEIDLFQTGPGTPWGDKKPKFHHPLYLE